MSTPSQAPPAQTPRLFIGGLSAGVTDDALTRLLSRFGTPGPLDRHATRPFAHISLTPRDDSSIDRCVAALNNTSWCGAALRVQRAREHYWNRLQREWRDPENGADGQGVLQVRDGEDGTAMEAGAGSAGRKPHFDGMGSGNHTRFSFPDVAESVVVDKLGFEQESINPACVDSGGGYLALEGKSAALEGVRGALREPSNRSVAKSATMSSTLQLFGLSKRSGSTGIDQQDARGGSPDNTAAALPNDGRPLKRPRRRGPSDAEIERAEAVEKEPALINLESEKETALSVLRHLLHSERKTKGATIGSCRRLGLFRKLETLQAAEQPAKPHGRQHKRLGDKRVSSKNLREAEPTSVAFKRREEIEPTAVQRLPQNCRRAGLYKKLSFTS